MSLLVSALVGFAGGVVGGLVVLKVAANVFKKKLQEQMGPLVGMFGGNVPGMGNIPTVPPEPSHFKKYGTGDEV